MNALDHTSACRPRRRLIYYAHVGRRCVRWCFSHKIFPCIFFFYCVSPAAPRAHYVTIMFGNVQHSALCSRVLLCIQPTTQDIQYIYIYIYIHRDNNLIGFPQPSHSAAILTTNAVFIGFFERAATKSASKSDKWSGNKSWINDEVVPIRGSSAYMDRRRWLVI